MWLNLNKKNIRDEMFPVFTDWQTDSFNIAIAVLIDKFSIQTFCYNFLNVS